MPETGDTSLEKRAAGLNGRKFSADERKQAQNDFLEAFAHTGVILEAVRRTLVRGVRVNRSVVDYWNEHDAEFAARYGQARREADDAIRAEIRRRAIEGTKRTIYQGGRKVGTIREYSDILLIFLAKARMPEFRQANDRAADAGAADDGSRKLSVIDIMEIAAQAEADQTTAAANDSSTVRG